MINRIVRAYRTRRQRSADGILGAARHYHLLKSCLDSWSLSRESLWHRFSTGEKRGLRTRVTLLLR